MTSSTDALRQAHSDICGWLFESALPLWWDTGRDRANGGFFEKISHAGAFVEAPRRTRVVGRQIYSYATAARLNWKGDARAAVDHGIDCLLSRCLKPDNTLLSEHAKDGTPIRVEFDLYDHAFALFGLAAAAGMRSDRDRLAQIALDVREAMIAGWKHPRHGFEESVPRTLPLKANPHMHIFEASLAWIEAGPLAGDGGWDRLADEIAELCLTKLLHPGNGCLREFFDGDWDAISGEEGRIIEPGHQYEWAWLLKRWGLMRNREDAIESARRLTEIAENHGTDTGRGVAFNEIYDDFSIRDDKARLWPQTERIKAWLAMADIATSDEEREKALGLAAVATRGLEKYVQTAIPGLWYDKMNKDGSFVPEDAPASSLYHIVCAISELDAAVERLS